MTVPSQLPRFLLQAVAMASAVLAGAAVAALASPHAAPPAPVPAPVPIVTEPVHLGDGEMDGFDHRLPDARVLVAKFDIPGAPPERSLLLMTVRDVTPSTHVECRMGRYLDVVRLNGRAVALLNEHVDRESPAAVAIAIPLDAGELRAGRNVLEVLPGSGPGPAGRPNLDDLEIVSASVVAAAPLCLSVREAETDAPVPARFTILGAEGTPDPSLGSRYRAGGAANFACTRSGEATLLLPAPGTYRAVASRGLEWSCDEATVAVGYPSGAPAALRIARVIDTPGAVGADFHVHAERSFDSAVALRDRALTCLAEGLEVVVATDHNCVTDYRPAIRALEAEAMLASVMGDEITTYDPGIGHFNAFPLALDSAAGDGGAPPWRGTTPAKLFERVRALGRPAPAIVQVNHPHDGTIGYFNLMGLDRTTGLASSALWSDAFDAIEVLNGIDTWANCHASLLDWFHLLNRGVRATGTANSDTHAVSEQEVGFPRNYVRLGIDAPGDVTPQALAEAVRAGAVTVSSGPYLEVWADGEPAPGREVSLAGRAEPARIALRVRVQAAPWVEVTQLEVVENGEPTWARSLGPAAVPAAAGAGSRSGAPPSAAVVFDGTIDLAPRRDTWVVVIARGERYLAPAVAAKEMIPFAFANPLWIDVDGADRDGDGRLFDAPWGRGTRAPPPAPAARHPERTRR